MTAYLLDTNHISPLVTPGHPLRNKIFACFQAGDTFAICAPVLNEVLFGIGVALRAQANWREWEYLKSSFNYYAVDSGDAEKAVRRRLELRRRGWQLDLVDSFVAIVALRYDLTVVSTDNDFEEIPGLKRENWLPT